MPLMSISGCILKVWWFQGNLATSYPFLRRVYPYLLWRPSYSPLVCLSSSYLPPIPVSIKTWGSIWRRLLPASSLLATIKVWSIRTVSFGRSFALVSPSVESLLWQSWNSSSPRYERVIRRPSPPPPRRPRYDEEYALCRPYEPPQGGPTREYSYQARYLTRAVESYRPD